MSPTEKPATPSAAKPSPVEVFKVESQYLKGDIPAELLDENDFFGKGSVQLLKHHGTYQQDDRDARAAAKASGKGKAFMFMVRSKIPGGKLTSDQLLAQLDLCDELGNNTLRITTRQALQLHGIRKNKLKETIARINEVQVSTLGACGDVNRNVMCCPAPYANNIHTTMQKLADDLAELLAPRTTAYHEIWLREEGSEEKQLVGGGVDGHEIEPIYGTAYLPRKFKIGVALPEDNCIDLYTHDLGFLAITEGDDVKGYNILVGGGFGNTPSAKKTFPAVAKRMCFVTPEQALDVAVAVVKVQRDFGNRTDRKVARLKYLIADWGIEKFKAKVEEYYGQSLPEPNPADVTKQEDHMGWEEQGDGKWFYGLNIENGRLRDGDDLQLKAALRDICKTIKPGIRLTAHQSLIFTDVEEKDKTAIEETLQKYHVPLSHEISNTRRWSMACVAWPTCGLSITEAERALPGMVDQLEVEIEKLGLSTEQFNLRMTGCPNGCARPYNPDIGLVGKAKGKYTVLLGGTQLGNRLNFIYKDLVPEEEVVSELTQVFRYFKESRTADESFGDFCHRKGKEDLLAWSEAENS
jgi:sulfite reductase (ferredoxin)